MPSGEVFCDTPSHFNPPSTTKCVLMFVVGGTVFIILESALHPLNASATLMMLYVAL